MAKKSRPAAPAKSTKTGPLAASVKPMTVGPGLYLLSVKAGTPRPTAVAGGLRLPALSISAAPGVPPGRVELVPGNSANGNWVSAPGDLLVAKVHAGGAALVLTSVRATGTAELAVRFERLDGSDRGGAVPAASASSATAAVPERRGPADGLRLQVGAHIRARGDTNFVEALWAGKLGKGYWIESFSVTPLEKLARQDVEYKGLTASGFESPWLTDGVPCGTRGMAIPLVGFAIRLKPQAAADYDCEYSGYFQSGVVVGPLRNGTPCRSTVANDPLEGLQVRIIPRGKRSPAGKPARQARKARPAAAKPAGKAAGRKRR